MRLTPVTPAFEADLRARLPGAAFRELSPAYLEEPRGRYRGQAGLLLAPATVGEVAEAVRVCAAARVGIVPYGGGTGLVGGQVMPDGPAPVILSLERMRAIRSVHPEENVLVAEAGAILADVQKAAEAIDRLFPLSLASEGSARVGGVLSTNAGGVNVLRYGNARDLCLGLEAVLPDGQIWHGLSRLRKDNTGYDLKNLLIGAEGTLGVITAAALRLYPRPGAQAAALMTVPGPSAALDLLALAGRRIGGGVSAFELISGVGLDFLAETMPEVKQPFARRPGWMVLIDVGLSAGQAAEGALEALFAEAVEAGLTEDGVISRAHRQRQAFWSLRESIPLANRRIGAVQSHDISLPLGAIPEFIESCGAALAGIGAFRINCFGHLGDGNLHYNVFPAPGRHREEYEDVRPAVRRCVHDMVVAMGGSFSAEHGIGRLKVEDLERYGDPAKLSAIRAIKSALDPVGILNPGVIVAAGCGGPRS